MCLFKVKINPALGTFPKVFKSEAIKVCQFEVDIILMMSWKQKSLHA